MKITTYKRRDFIKLAGFCGLDFWGCQPQSTPKVSEFCQHLEPVGRILEDKDWFVWGCSPIYDDQSRVHVFLCRWPTETRMVGWLTDSEVAHAVADHPRGPYTVLGTVLKGEKNGSWDHTIYNPTIHKVDDTYALFYAGRSTHEDRIKQQIGLAVASSLDGPWSRVSDKPIIPYSGQPGTWNALHASNPAFLRHPNGQYWVYYKGISDKTDPPLRTIGVAVADQLEGPYRDHPDNPVIEYIDRGIDIEDPYAFYYENTFYMIVEDRMGVLEPTGKKPVTEHVGGVRPGLLYTSDDGIHWSTPRIGYRRSDFYFDEQVQRFERPQLLMRNGKPDYVFLALKGGQYNTSSGSVLNIKDL